jgi:hypothetical protein
VTTARSADSNSTHAAAASPRALPAALQRWFAERSLDDSHARLAEAGAGVGTEILLSEVFVDLVAEHEGQDRSALALVTGALSTRSRALLVFGGPGEGKSSLTAMAALLLRASWVDEQPDWPPPFSQRYRRLIESLRSQTEALDGTSRSIIPLRVDLPSFVTKRARHLDETGETLSFWQWMADAFEIKSRQLRPDPPVSVITESGATPV